MTGGPSLLVSVRDAAEAEDALEGGADWIDLKEPLRGPLGPVSPAVAARVVTCVCDRVPVSAACGELADYPDGGSAELARLPGLRLLKFGTAGCGSSGEWLGRLEEAVATTHSDGKRLALGAYADWRCAEAPSPEEVIAAAAGAGVDWVLLDTFDKQGPGLMDLLSPDLVGILANQTAKNHLGMAVAGRLMVEDIKRLCERVPVVFGVRGAVCAGGRTGRISRERVAEAAAVVSKVCGRERTRPFA